MLTLFACYKAHRACGQSPKSALRIAKSDFARGYVVYAPRSRKRSFLGPGDCIRWRDENGNRRTAVVAIVPDESHGAPWENEDGHGPVTDWTRRDKTPGELVLCEDRGSRRFYDFAEAVRTARRDCWGVNDIATETARQRATRAAREDFERLRRWCNAQWSYVGVCLFELPRDGVERSPSHVADSAPFGILNHAALWGIESDCDDYHDEVARELTSEL